MVSRIDPPPLPKSFRYEYKRATGKWPSRRDIKLINYKILKEHSKSVLKKARNEPSETDEIDLKYAATSFYVPYLSMFKTPSVKLKDYEDPDSDFYDPLRVIKERWGISS